MFRKIAQDELKRERENSELVGLLEDCIILSYIFVDRYSVATAISSI